MRETPSHTERQPGTPLRFQDAEHAVFVSYAHAGNNLCGNWMDDFAVQLQRSLADKLSGTLPGDARMNVHLSQKNGPIKGDLSKELHERVARSFAMVIVVEDKYVQSSWCLRELETFKALFGEAGLDQRLYILALSRPSILALEQRPSWSAMFADRDQVWTSFFQDDGDGSDYVPVLRDDGKGPTNEFSRRFKRLLDSMAGLIEADLKSGPEDSTSVSAGDRPTGNSAPGRPPTDGVGARAGESPSVVFGACRPELQPQVDELAQRLRGAGLTVSVMDSQSAVARPPAFDQAEVLVLPVNRGQPLLDDMAVGGHLAVQRRAWAKRLKPGARLLLLDLQAVAAPAPADEEQSQYLDTLQREELTSPLALLEQFGAAPPGAPTVPAEGKSKVVKLYIESNPMERDEWEQLGERIQCRWNSVLQRHKVDVDIHLKHLGLPVERIQSLGNLDHADGFIMLWGCKQEAAVFSQINKLEELTHDRIPGIVALLSPPQPVSQKAVPAVGWRVLRFDATDRPRIDIEPQDDEYLNTFLASVLKRSSKRLGLVLH